MSENNRKILFFSVVFTTLMCGIYFFYLASSRDSIQEIREQITYKQKELDQLKYYKSNLSLIEKQLQDVEKELTLIEGRLPDANYSSEFVSDLYKEVKAKRIKVDNINVTSYRDSTLGEVSKISVESSGNIKSISSVINYLNGYKRELIVKTFNLQARPNNTYSAVINVEMYYAQ